MLKKRVFMIVFIGLVILSIYYISSILNKEHSTSKPKETIAENTTAQTNFGCARTTRLENLPQYDRALSLIQQRISENNQWWDIHGDKNDGRFYYFPAQLTNCITIQEDTTDVKSSLEGYFTLNNNAIKNNYYPININSKYKEADDIATALLLTHEITHVQQFIDSKNSKNTNSCIKNEINAFMAQLDFYVILNGEEQSSVYQRIENDKYLHPQLQMLNTMMSINREVLNTCKFNEECTKNHLLSRLNEILVNDETYKKECEL